MGKSDAPRLHPIDAILLAVVAVLVAGLTLVSPLGVLFVFGVMFVGFVLILIPIV